MAQFLALVPPARSFAGMSRRAALVPRFNRNDGRFALLGFAEESRH
jgi:hypothetical protein